MSPIGTDRHGLRWGAAPQAGAILARLTSRDVSLGTTNLWSLGALPPSTACRLPTSRNGTGRHGRPSEASAAATTSVMRWIGTVRLWRCGLWGRCHTSTAVELGAL